jgi:two-component system response regulator YesN
MFKVLIVDDEPQIRKGLHTIIPWESLGFVVTAEAEDGIEALERVEENMPDVVITDIKMPRMDGIELSGELKSRFPDVHVLVLSGYNEFVYAKEAMKRGVGDYLLKPIDPDEMIPIMQKVYDHLWERLQSRIKEKEKEKSLKDFFFGKLIRGEIHGDVKHAAKDYGLQLSGYRFGIVIVNLDKYGEILLSLSARQIGLKRFATKNVIQEILGGRGYMFEMSEQQFGILLMKPLDIDMESLRRFAEKLVDCMTTYVKESVKVGVGPIVGNPRDIRDSYEGALKALEQKFFLNSQQVFLYQSPNASASVPSIRWDDKSLLQAIREGKPERITGETEKLLGPLDRHVITLEELKFHIMTTIIHLAKLFEEHHGDWETFYTGKFAELERIMEYEAISRLKAFLIDISLEICQYLLDSTERKVDNRIQDIVNHIDSHYRDEMNLKELSKMFYVNAVYLGQLFKKETGEYFNDYMNKVRIRHACALLEQTDLPASEIGERVGYKYADHFYRKFKQLHGINPGEYRKQHSQR